MYVCMYCLSEDPRVPPSTNNFMMGFSQEFLPILRPSASCCERSSDSKTISTGSVLWPKGAGIKEESYGNFLSHRGTPSHHPNLGRIFPNKNHPAMGVPPWPWKPPLMWISWGYMGTPTA